jgi:two-component system sensor histidine kinase AtoS
LPIDSPALRSFARILKVNRYRDFFRVLSDSLDDVVLVITGNDFQILTCNHAFLLFSGYARPDIESLKLTDLLHDDKERIILAQLSEGLEKPNFNIDNVPFRTRGGEVAPIDLQVRSVGNLPSTLVLIGRPVRDRIHIEGQRRAQQDRLDNLVHMSALIIDEMHAALPNALTLAESLLCASFVGLYRVSSASPDYVLDGPLPSEFPKILPASALTHLQQAGIWKLGQRPEHVLHKAARASGLGALNTSLIGIHTAWVGVLVVGWDDLEAIPYDAEQLMDVIANLCHAAIQLRLQRATVAEGEKALEEIKAEVNDQFSAISDTLIALDAGLQITQANPAISRLLGYQPEEVSGLPIHDVLVGPGDIQSILQEALISQSVADHMRITLHRRDGTPFPVDLRAVPLSDKARSRLLIILKDQSAQQEIELQAETLAQRALLGEVTATFAHEVRNPINNISTGVQLIASRLGEDHPLYDSLEKIHKECNRLDQLMSDVLFYARPLNLKIEPLNLAEYIDRILSRWKPRLSLADIRCHTSYNPSTPLALVDSHTLERVIVNLISNALQAMPEGGTLSVALEATEIAQDKMVELKIIDTGHGIPHDVINRIFDPFFTTKKEGTGLGLAISRRILAAHNGTIEVESFTDAGTVFTINLPVAS